MIDTTIDQCRSNGRFLYVNLGQPVFLGFFFTCSGRERSWISDSAFVDYVKKPMKSAWSGRRPTYGYLPSRGASRPLTVTKLHCFVDRDTYEHVYSPERWTNRQR